MRDIVNIVMDNEIGLIVRGKQAPDYASSPISQHADCVLKNGSLVGFYGVDGGASSGVSGSVGIGMQGGVLRYDKIRIRTRQYVDAEYASTVGPISTLLLIKVSNTESTLFDAAWNEMEFHPGEFNIVGNNCASHASRAFIKAGVVSSEMPGLDTPDNLYHQIVSVRKGGTRSISGFIGFSKVERGYNVQIIIPK